MDRQTMALMGLKRDLPLALRIGEMEVQGRRGSCRVGGNYIICVRTIWCG